MTEEIQKQNIDSNIVKSAKNNSITLASLMLEQIKIDGKYAIYEKSQRMIYLFNGISYDPFEEIDIDKFLQEFFIQNGITEIWKSNRLSEIKRAMLVNSSLPRVSLDEYSNLLCFKNCILNMDTMETLPHSKDYYFSSAINVDFLPNAPSPLKFNEFLKSTFRKRNGEIDYDTMDNAIKAMGYLIYPQNKGIKLPKLFLFLGEGANGKSMLMDIIKMFFLEKSISYLTLEQLSSCSFERTKLIGSRINISTEAKETGVDAEEIKKIISGEGITIRPLFKEAFSFYPTTKICIASNTRPYFKDSTYGILRRLYILDFPNRFIPMDKYNELVKRKQDPAKSSIYPAGDYQKMMDEFRAEASGILNLFLDGLLSLKSQEWILGESEATKELTADYSKSNDQLGMWLIDNFHIDDDPNNKSYYTATDILHTYREWYYLNVSQRALNLSAISVSTKIKETFRIESDRVYQNGKQVRAFRLILNSEAE